MRRIGASAQLLKAALVAAALLLVPHRVTLQPDTATLPNVILVVLDTFRADRLGAYGKHPSVTPFLDRWAAASMVYERAYAPSSWTIPSIASLFLAREPSAHGVTGWQGILSQRDLTLAETLQQNGFHTGAFSANPQIAVTNGFGQGFERFLLLSMNFEPGDAPQLNRAALSWLDDIERAPQARRPFFLYLQYMETHAPYHFRAGTTPPHPAGLPATDTELNTRLTNGAIAIALGDTHPWQFDAAEVQRLSTLYDGDAAYLDAELADLFNTLDARGRMRNTLVIITAEHGEFLHGASLYEPAIRVPLLIRLPGETSARRVSTPVELTGLAPALLTQLGIQPPPAFHPSAALAISAGTSGADLGVHSELIPPEAHTFRLHRHAFIRATHKLLVSQSGDYEYYDLARDPDEAHPLKAPAFADELQLALARITEAAGPPARSESAPIDDATRQRLRSLGYVQ